MADNDKLSIRSGWFQFLVTQILAFLVYSLGLAYWLGGFSTRVEQHDKQIAAQEVRITDLDRNDTQPGRLSSQLNASQERRIIQLEDTMNVMRPKVDVIATQVDAIDKKLDRALTNK